LGEAGRLSQEAIAEVRQEVWPDIRDEHELHDLLCALVVVPAEVLSWNEACRDWDVFLGRLERAGRVTMARRMTPGNEGRTYFVAAERAEWLRGLWADVEFSVEMLKMPGEVPDNSDILKRLLQGWLQITGPVTSAGIGERLGLDAGAVWQQMVRLESTGTILRGVFEGRPGRESVPDVEIEWCERRILQRIHRRTLSTLRKQIEPVTPAVYMRFLLDWQHLAERRQLTGEQGLMEALRGLEGFEAPAAEWERSILPQRVAGYDPRWLDALCLTGAVGWGRISPHAAFVEAGGENGARGPRRVVPTSMAPVTFFVREEALWMDLCLSQRQIPEAHLTACLSELANRVRSCLGERGAMFSADLIRMLGVPAEEVHRALWELVAAGLVNADGFDSLRVLIDPRRKRAFAGAGTFSGKTKATGRNASGRWALLVDPGEVVQFGESKRGDAEVAGQAAARRDAQVESACLMLLRRYGVVLRDVLARETTVPPWRELVGMFRRLEARGVVRGGRFVSGFGGEQFALPEAADALRANRTRTLADMPPVTMAAADPMNLVGVVIPGERTASIAGNTVTLPLAPTEAEALVVEMPVAGAFAFGAVVEGGAIA
jgi:ATP-dependent Lhr-like helicase